MGRRTIWIPRDLEAELQAIARRERLTFSAVVVQHVLLARRAVELAGRSTVGGS